MIPREIIYPVIALLVGIDIGLLIASAIVHYEFAHSLNHRRKK